MICNVYGLAAIIWIELESILTDSVSMIFRCVMPVVVLFRTGCCSAGNHLSDILLLKISAVVFMLFIIGIQGCHALVDTVIGLSMGFQSPVMGTTAGYLPDCIIRLNGWRRVLLTDVNAGCVQRFQVTVIPFEGTPVMAEVGGT